MVLGIDLLEVPAALLVDGQICCCLLLHFLNDGWGQCVYVQNRFSGGLSVNLHRNGRGVRKNRPGSSHRDCPLSFSTCVLHGVVFSAALHLERRKQGGGCPVRGI